MFDSLSWTEAQKQDAPQYRSGMAIRFHRSKGSFNKDESVQVVAVENDSLKVQRADGTESRFPLGRGAAAFDVGEERKLKVAAGDKLLLQANWRKKFVNGELVEVKAVQGESLVLADGRIIPADYRTFTHGYAVTSHAAQGQTVDEVLVVASSRSMTAVSQEQFYVSISRGRDACRVFTDDKDLLRSRITHSSARVAAVEVMSPQRRQFIQTVLWRGHRFLKRLNIFRHPSLSPRRGTNRTQAYEHQPTHRVSF